MIIIVIIVIIVTIVIIEIILITVIKKLHASLQGSCLLHHVSETTNIF